MVIGDHFRVPDGWQPLDLGVGDGWAVFRVGETGSTNVDLARAAQRGAPHHTVLIADHQTAGRGRLDRTWEAPPGANLLVSILFRDPGDDASELTRRVGVAAVGAARTVAGVDPRLKWPNDLLLDGKKLAGILAQRSGDGAAVVVGLGLNVGWAPEGAALLGAQHRPLAVLAELLAELDRLPASVDGAYHDLLDTLGRNVRVELPNGEQLTGRAVDVTPDGRLLVIDGCAVTHRIDVGDVVHVRAAEAGSGSS